MQNADVEALGLLNDPQRRSLYEFVIRQGRDVGRNEAAQAVGLQRTLAAFHLDRLADAGLLEVGFRRLSGRSGPGAGRPAKVYRRAPTERSISLPPRDYSRAAAVFADAIERAGAEDALYAAARAEGVLAGQVLAASGGSVSLGEVKQDLARRGYEPDQEQADARVRLRNCPFHAVAEEFPALTCGMNVAMLDGLLQGAGLSERYVARIAAEAGACCVVIESKNNQS